MLQQTAAVIASLRHPVSAEERMDCWRRRCFVDDWVRMADFLCGVLTLSRTYGYEPGKTNGHQSNKHRRAFYQCIPFDPNVPPFLIPFDAAKHLRGFSKAPTALLVRFRFAEWCAPISHPVGTLVEVLGRVDHAECFALYLLHANGVYLPSSATFSNLCALLPHDEEVAVAQLAAHPYCQPHGGCRSLAQTETWCANSLFSIDPAGCEDIDDAIAVAPPCAEHPDRAIVRICIAHVAAWMECLGLWDRYPGRITTIYAPTHRWPMLPPQLSEQWMSLHAGHARPAIVLEVHIILQTAVSSPRSGGENVAGALYHVEQRCYSAWIRVAANMSYEQAAADPRLSPLREWTRQFAQSDASPLPPWTEEQAASSDMHDIVAFWMLAMNVHGAQSIAAPIFRHTDHHDLLEEVEETEEVEAVEAVEAVEETDVAHTQTVKKKEKEDESGWRRVALSATYGLQSLPHESIGVASYLHWTSPIRRLVDMVNQVQWWRRYLAEHHLCAMDLPDSAAAVFAQRWKDQLTLVQAHTRQIRRVQDWLFWIAARDQSIWAGVLVHRATTAATNTNTNTNNKVQEEVERWTVWLPKAQRQVTVRVRHAEAVARAYVGVRGQVFCQLHIFWCQTRLHQRIRFALVKGHEKENNPEHSPWQGSLDH